MFRELKITGFVVLSLTLITFAGYGSEEGSEADGGNREAGTTVEAGTYYDFERRLPESPMMVYYSGGASSLERLGRDTVITSIWLDEGLRDSLATPYSNLIDMLSSKESIPPPVINLGIPLLEGLAISPWCLVVESADIDFENLGSEPPTKEDLKGLRLAWIIHTPPESRALEASEAIDNLLSMTVHTEKGEKDSPITRAQGLPVSLTWGRQDELFVMAIGEGVGEAILEKNPGEPNEDFVKIRRQVTGEEEPLDLIHVEYSEMISLFQQAAAVADTKQYSETEWEQLKKSIPSISYASSAAGKGIKDRVAMPIGEESFIQPDISITLEDLSPVPENALALVTFAGDFASHFDKMYKYMEEDALKQMEKLEAELGVNIEEDLVAHLGEKVFFYLPEWGDDRDYPDPVVLFELSDSESFRSSLATIAARPKKDVAEEEEELALTSGEHRGHSFKTIKFADDSIPFSPSWTVSDKFFVLSGTLEELKSVLDHIKSGNASIAESKDFMEAYDSVRKKDFVSLYYIASGAKKNLINIIYKDLLPKYEELEGESVEKLEFDPGSLPSTENLKQHMFPTMHITYCKDDMVFSEGYGPFGGASSHAKGAVASVFPASAVSGFMAAHQMQTQMDGSEEFEESEMQRPEGPTQPTMPRSQLIDAIGPNLVNAEGKEVPSQKIKNKDYVLLYFSAEWCPPCKKFTPSLFEFYDEYSEKANLEVIFVSSDRSAEDMMNYMQNYGMDFLAVPFDRIEGSNLSETYGVHGIPRLVAMDEEGEVVKDSAIDNRSKILSELAEIVEEKE